MRNALILTAALALATPAAAFDIDAMSEAERQSFRAEIRSYLLDNPEVLMEAIGVLEGRQAQEQASNDGALIAANAAALFEDEMSYVGGNPEGDLVIVEFMDYRCGFCRRAHPEVNALVESDGNIRRIIKEFPILGEQSVMASRFAIATRMLAGDAAYWGAHEALIAMREAVSDASLRRVAADLGLDAEAILARMDAPEITQIIADNHALAQRMAITGTPTFVMGEQMLRGYLPLEGMREVVAEERG